MKPGTRFILFVLVAAILIYEQTGYAPPSFEKQDFYTLVDRTAERVRGAEALYIQPVYTDTKGRTSVSVYGEVFAMWVGLRQRAGSERLLGTPASGPLSVGVIRRRSIARSVALGALPRTAASPHSG